MLNFESRKNNRENELTDVEDDCMREIRCFVQAGSLTQQMLPRVIKGIWLHWEIVDEARKQHILKTAGVYEAGMDVVDLM